MSHNPYNSLKIKQLSNIRISIYPPSVIDKKMFLIQSLNIKIEIDTLA